jgi:pyruvate formate lyase activating enzyme
MRYSVHDGPGIRTTVFFKGCPLSCKWCHNPEGIEQKPQQVFNAKKCIKCGRCAGEAGGAGKTGGENCPTGARETIGSEITLAGLMKELNKDLLFYEQSNGGVTFSGGEPFYQAEFLLEALKACKEDHINTAVDTSGFCDAEAILKAAEIANYFLYDLKFIDSEKHEKYCGSPNEIILKNLLSVSQAKAKILIRIPVIPSINDDLCEMTGIFEFIKDIKNIETVHLLPYHNIQADKYNRIGKRYELPEISGDASPNMDEIKRLFSAKFRIKAGG